MFTADTMHMGRQTDEETGMLTCIANVTLAMDVYALWNFELCFFIFASERMFTADTTPSDGPADMLNSI